MRRPTVRSRARSVRPRTTTLGDLIAAAYDALGPGAPADRVAWLLSSTRVHRRAAHRAVRFG